MELRARRIVASPAFHHGVTLLIVAAAVLIGLEAYEESAGIESRLVRTLDAVILLAFIAEIAVRFAAESSRPGRFFREPWNVFDLSLVIGALIPMTAGLAGVLRMVRLMRMLRLVRHLPRLRVLLATTLVAIPSLLSIVVLLGLLFYSYAAAGVFLFSENDPIHFANLHTSFVSLFRVITLEDWTDIMYTQMYGCANYGYEASPELCTQSHAFGTWGAIFFISFVFIGSWVVLNLFIGIIIIGMDEARARVRVEVPKSAARARVPLSEIDLELRRVHERLGTLQMIVGGLIGGVDGNSPESTNHTDQHEESINLADQHEEAGTMSTPVDGDGSFVAADGHDSR